MIRFHTPFDGNRFIGDKKRMIFHDLFFESGLARVGGCQIDRIAREDVRTFNPDNISTAIKEGFQPCRICLWTCDVLYE